MSMLKYLLILVLLCLFAISGKADYYGPPSPPGSGNCGALGGEITGTCAAASVISYPTPCNTAANGSTDDTTTLNACIAAANLTGNVAIALPIGDTTITSATPITAANIWFVCLGGPGTCNIKASTANALSWDNHNGGGLYNVGLKNAGTSTIKLIHLVGTTNWQMINAVMDPAGTIGGLITADTGANGIIVDGAIGPVNNAAVCLFDMSGGAGFRLISSRLYTTATPGSATSGRDAICSKSASVDTIELWNNQLIAFDRPVNIAAANGIIIDNIFIWGNVFDSMNNAMLFSAASGGNISIVAVQQNELSSLVGETVTLSGAGSLESYKISQNTINSAGTNGIHVAGSGTVKAIDINDNTLKGINHAAGGGIGILVDSGSYITVQLNKVLNLPDIISGNPTYGCTFAAIVDNGIFSGNNCNGSTARYNGMVSGTTTTSFAHTNWQQIGNVGLDSYITGQFTAHIGTNTNLQTGNPALVSGSVALVAVNDAANANIPIEVRASEVVLTAGGLVLGTVSPAAIPAAGELAGAKISPPGTAPGAGIGKIMWVAGTIGGTCKLIAYAGTSTTPTTVVDNVGTGC